jgi:linoleate 8R-lipoxygenase / 9,12-octadecadienoate 8-hydroperoxide 8R-isomerase
VTCGLYVNVILLDYVRTILGLNRTNDLWNLDPRSAGPHVYSTEGAPMGVGNQVSCEFSLLYRWHAAISDRDDKWTQGFLHKLFPGRDIYNLSLEEFRVGLATWLASIDEDPGKRTLDMGSLARGKDGTFDDSTLIKILTEGIEDCAGIPQLLFVVDDSVV